jgi:diguanylate cyclase (GGDEF)-like protein
MPISRLDLSHFSDSAYVHELRRGYGVHLFQPSLETEYRIVHVDRVRWRVRIWTSLSAALAVLFTLVQVRQGGAWTLNSMAHLYLLLPCAGALACVVWSRHYERWYLSVASVLVPLYNVLITVFIVLALRAGKDEQLSALTVNLVAVFFFTGLMFRQAILTCVGMLVAFATAPIISSVAPAMFVKSMAIMTLTSGIAAILYWDVEKTNRNSFLEAALIDELISRDALSGLMNRRAFDDHLLRVWHQALRDKRSVAIIMIDIDHFKSYNDEFGHQAGDLALQSIARIIQGFGRRPLDIAARYGGEEFAMILYDLTVEHVADTAERLREAVQNRQKTHNVAGAAMDREVTVSVGVAVVTPAIGRTPPGVLQLADEALYEAKQSGRNRVVIKDSEAYQHLVTGAFKGPLTKRRVVA